MFGRTDLRDEIMSSVYSAIAHDVDARTYLDEAEKAMAALIEGCCVEIGADDTPHTKTLVENWIAFAYGYGMPGGSLADYAAEAAVSAVDGTYTFRIADPDLVNELYDEVNEHALYPDDLLAELASCGITPREAEETRSSF